jgi:hypothetical protein
LLKQIGFLTILRTRRTFTRHGKTGFRWAKEKDLNYFQMVLGAVQTGAVGYMAYRHVKKYGLFR